jgi:hypothetical protein
MIQYAGLGQASRSALSIPCLWNLAAGLMIAEGEVPGTGFFVYLPLTIRE